MVELRSRSEKEKEWCGDPLGLYQLTVDTREESLRQGVVYRQPHDGDDWQFYLYR